MKTALKSLLTFTFALLLLTACNDDDDTNLAIPQLSTIAVTEITSSSAQSGGNITGDGGAPVSSRGVVWSSEQAPSLESHLGLTVDGGGLGVFTSSISGLSGGQTYYVRAYATNPAGTAYGQELEFNTSGNVSSAAYPEGAVHCIPGGAEVVEVLNPETGKIWMDRNLGASQVATAPDDEAAYGDLYQWGRFSDGHQCRNSETTSTNANTAAPNQGNSWDGKFILEPSSPYDWLSSQNNNLWQGVNGINNPCPQGYRIPSEAEWLSWGLTNSSTALGSALKLPATGFRDYYDDWFFAVGSTGFYWSSTVSGTEARNLAFQSSTAGTNVEARASGFAVRCIKD